VQDDMSVDDLKLLAVNHGLTLSDEEAGRALAGANRWRNQVAQMRALVTRNLQPAPVFRAPQREREE
jgi:hypothetical protein